MSINQELVEKENMGLEGNPMEDNANIFVPPEIWVKIFKMLPKTKNLFKLRLVCKQWQATVDENFDMKVKINDDKMDVNSVSNFKRVVHGNVSKFIRDDLLLPSPTQLFWDPEFLSTLSLRGLITRSNFLLIAQQCRSVKELFLTGSLLNGDLSIFEVESNEDQSVLSNFMSSLHKLVVSGLHIEASPTNPTPVNLFSLFKWSMVELKTLVVRVKFWGAAGDTLFFGPLENCRVLESIEFTFPMECSLLQVRPMLFVLPTLRSLSIVVCLQERLLDWIPFIGSQSSIRDLKMVVVCLGFQLNQQVVDAVLKNAKNLKSLEMRTLNDVNVDASVQLFGELSNLDRLVLHGEYHPKLNNLELLSDSLQVLVLENFECDKQDVAVISERVPNVRTINLKI